MVQSIGKDLVSHCKCLKFNFLYLQPMCMLIRVGQVRWVKLKQFGEVQLSQVRQPRLSQAKVTPTRPKCLFSTYLDPFTTYLFINFLNNNLKSDFNLGTNYSQSKYKVGSLSINQIVNYYVNQNDKVQIDYHIKPVCPNSTCPN